MEKKVSNEIDLDDYEILHTVSVVQELFDREVAEKYAVLLKPKWRKQAQKIQSEMQKFYQIIGADTLK